MTRSRLAEHLETAIRQEDPARKLHLAGIVLANDPADVGARAIAALCFPDLRRAVPMLDAVAEAARRPGALADASPAVKAVVEVVRASREAVGLEPHAVTERLSGLVRKDLPDGVLAPVARLLMSAAASTGDADALYMALKRGNALRSLKPEAAWFGYVHAALLRKPEAGLALDAAVAACPGVRDMLEGARPMPEPANPGAFTGLGDAVILAAVAPGVFRAGGLPGRKPERKQATRAA